MEQNILCIVNNNITYGDPFDTKINKQNPYVYLRFIL
jgi:hypothetical protein